MSSRLTRTVVRFFIPAWVDPTKRPAQADVRWTAIAGGIGDEATWERVRSQVTAAGLVLGSAGPDDAPAVQALLPLLARSLAEQWGGCSISVQQEPFTAEATPERLWAYRINRSVVAKPGADQATWAMERAFPAGEPREAYEADAARRLTAALHREAATWGVDLPQDGPLLTVLDAGRPMVLPGLKGGQAVLARLGMLVAGHVRLDGLWSAGPLARLGFGWLERTHVPREIGASSARRLATRSYDPAENCL